MKQNDTIISCLLEDKAEKGLDSSMFRKFGNFLIKRVHGGGVFKSTKTTGEWS